MEFINAQEALRKVITENEELGELKISITSRALKNEKAIGNPDRKDFPLLTGKEVLLQADIDGFLGQALTNKMGQVKKTIHCLNNEPEDCAKEICKEIIEKHGHCKVGIIGYQPAILEHCAQAFGAENVMITDLNSDNVGDMRYGVKVMDGFTDTKQLVEFADVLLVTGTILANGTDRGVLMKIQEKPFYFFGTTCAGLAHINDYKRICPLSR
jgi:hypothetical protein